MRRYRSDKTTGPEQVFSDLCFNFEDIDYRKNHGTSSQASPSFRTSLRLRPEVLPSAFLPTIIHGLWWQSLASCSHRHAIHASFLASHSFWQSLACPTPRTVVVCSSSEPTWSQLTRFGIMMIDSSDGPPYILQMSRHSIGCVRFRKTRSASRVWPGDRRLWNVRTGKQNRSGRIFVVSGVSPLKRGLCSSEM